MIRYCITVIENSLTTAMLAALISAAVWKGGDLRGRKIFALGSALGCAAALCLAVLRRTTAINIGIVNAWILAAAFAASLVFIVLLWRDDGASRPVRFSLSSSALAGPLLFYALPSLFLLPSEFVLAGQSVFSTEFLINLAGAALGLALVILAAYALFRLVVPVGENPRSVQTPPWFKIILSALLLANMINHSAEVTRFLMARRIIPLWRGLFKIIMAVSNNKNVFLFLGIGIAALLPLMILFGKKSALKHGGAEAGPGLKQLNPAEKRKQRATLRRLRRCCGLAVVVLAFGVFALTGLKAWDRREVALSPPEPFNLEGEEILIPIERIEDGRLHRFAWNASDSTEVRFIVIKKSAAAWGVGLDACDICGNTGYYERRDGVICKLCDVVMNKSTIGFKGGCNPVPLNYTVRGGAMVVETADLENEKGRFK